MLSQFRVARLASAEEFDRLLNEVLMNGRPVPLSARLRLSAPGSLAPSALGLALARLSELTWRPEPPAADLAEALLERQSPSGEFGSIASTACALAGLGALTAQIAALPGTKAGMEFLPPGLTQRVRASADAAANWLASRTAENQPSLFDATEDDSAERAASADRAAAAPAPIGDAIDTAILLWALSAAPAMLARVGLPAPEAVIDDLGLRHRRETSTLVEAIASTRTASATSTRRAA